MKRFLCTFQFEFINGLKRKSYIITTILAAILIYFGIGFFLKSESVDHGSEENVAEESFVIYDQQHILSQEILKQYFPTSTATFVNSIEEIQQQIKENENLIGVALEDYHKIEYYAQKETFFTQFHQQFVKMIKRLYQVQVLADYQVPNDKIVEILEPKITYHMNVNDTNASKNLIFSYISVFMIYFIVIMNGSQIALNVANEKSNRSIEILTTSTSPASLITGKVFAYVALAVLQIALWVLSFYLAITMQRSLMVSEFLSYLHISKECILIFIFFSVIGIICYSFLFAACGAICNRIEDVNTACTPILLIFVVSFIIINSDLQGNTILSKILFYLPITSFMKVLSAYALAQVTFMEVFISGTILTIFTILVVQFSIYFYRRATLYYGNKLTFKTFFEVFRKQ